MNFTAILVFGIVISIVDLLIINYFSNEFFQLKFVNKIPMVIIKSKYFFLPLTTKIREYNDLQGAYIRQRLKVNNNNRQNTHNYNRIKIEYNLELEFKNRRRIRLFNTERTDRKLSIYCDEINYALKNFQDCSISKYDSSKVITAIILVLIISSLILIIPMINGGHLIDKIYCFAVTILILSVFFSLSLMVNRSKKNNQTSYYSNKENIDIDSESDRINDSIIK